MPNGVSHDLVGGEVTMLTSSCGKCGRRRMARIEILRLTQDGVSHAGETVVCVDCDTKPAP